MEYIKKFYGGVPLLFFLKFFAFAFNFRIDKKNSLNHFQKFLISRLFRFGYEVEFKKLNFIEAYRYRIYESINVLEDRISGNKLIYSNYLRCILNNELSDFIKSDKNLINRLNQLQINNHEKIVIKKPKFKFKNILYLGPKAEISDKNLKKYDLVITNKLLPDHIMEGIKKIFLVTGNLWLKKNANKLELKLKKFKSLNIFSTLESTFSQFPDSFSSLPQFPGGASLMNFQRTLYFVSNEVEYDSLEILGFDFFTSKVKKNPWYEKQAIRLIDNEKENFIYSLMKHDYLLNLMFAKNIIRKMPNIESNFYSFLEGRSIKDFFDFFKKNL